MAAGDDAMDEETGRREILGKLLELGGQVVELRGQTLGDVPGNAQVVMVDIHPTDRLMALLGVEMAAIPHGPVMLVAEDGTGRAGDGTGHPVIELVPGYRNESLDRAFERMRRDVVVLGDRMLAAEAMCKVVAMESPDREKDFYRDFERRRPDGSFARGKGKRRRR